MVCAPSVSAILTLVATMITPTQMARHSKRNVTSNDLAEHDALAGRSESQFIPFNFPPIGKLFVRPMPGGPGTNIRPQMQTDPGFPLKPRPVRPLRPATRLPATPTTQPTIRPPPSYIPLPPSTSWGGVMDDWLIPKVPPPALITRMHAKIDGNLDGFDCALVADSGSSGTRLYVVQRNAEKPDGVEIEDIGRVKGGLLKELRLRKEGIYDVRPEYIRFAQNSWPYASKKEFYSEMQKLFEKGVQKVPAWAAGRCPLRVLGTAGMRQASNQEQLEISADLTATVWETAGLDHWNFKFSIITGEDEGRFAWIAANAVSTKIGGGTVPVVDLGGQSAQVAGSTVGSFEADVLVSARLGTRRFKDECEAEINRWCRTASLLCPVFVFRLLDGSIVCRGTKAQLGKGIIELSNSFAKPPDYLSEQERGRLRSILDIELSSFTRVVTLGQIRRIPRFFQWLAQNFPEELIAYQPPDESLGDWLESITWKTTMTRRQFQALTRTVCAMPLPLLRKKWRASGETDKQRDLVTGRNTEKQVANVCCDSSFANGLLGLFGVPMESELEFGQSVDWPKGAFLAML